MLVMGPPDTSVERDTNGLHVRDLNTMPAGSRDHGGVTSISIWADGIAECWRSNSRDL